MKLKKKTKNKKKLQDITSEIPPLQPACNEEVIINCRQQQQQQQQQKQQHRTQQQHLYQKRLQSSNNLAATTTTNSTTATANNTTSISSLQQHLKQYHQQHQNQQRQLQQQQNQNQKLITRSQSSKVIQDFQHHHHHHPFHQLKQQQSLPTPLHGNVDASSPNVHNHSKSVSILVYKTLNTVFKSSRKIIVRVCEVASVKKNFNMFKFNKASQQTRADARANACTGHDQFVRPPVSEK